MSWFSSVPTSSTRSNNPNFTGEAREKRRLDLEAKRKAAKERSEEKRRSLASVSLPASPNRNAMSSAAAAAAAALAAQQQQQQQNAAAAAAAQQQHNQNQPAQPPAGPPAPGGPPGPPGPPDGGPPGGGGGGGPAPPPPPIGNNNQANQGIPPAQQMDFDAENGVDGDRAQELARHIRVEFEPNDVNFWFSQLEGELLMASVNSQWMKKTVLQRNLPNKVKEDVKAYLELPRTAAGPQIYLEVKREILRIYAPKPQESYRKALTRTMTGLPSQLGYQLINDICKQPRKLFRCCCAEAVLTLWSLQLPVSVRAHISDREFNIDTYKDVFETADNVFQSSKQVSVAAFAVTNRSASNSKGGAAGSNMDETLPAFDSHNVQEVAAFKQEKGKGNRGGSGRGGRGNRGGRRGGARPPRHSSNPPEQCCDRHYQFGDQTWYCTKPLTCPWVNKVVSK